MLFQIYNSIVLACSEARFIRYTCKNEINATKRKSFLCHYSLFNYYLKTYNRKHSIQEMITPEHNSPLIVIFTLNFR